MPNKRYLSGRQLEYQVKKFFKSAGMSTIRAAGSHGEWDIVAIDDINRIIYLVQCKRGKKMEELRGGYYSVRKITVGSIKQLYEYANGGDDDDDDDDDDGD